SFEDVDSHRFRVGARISHGLTDTVKPYFGAAYEVEADGKARASSRGLAFDVPELKGGAGLGELGVTVAAGEAVKVDVGLQGCTGGRQGVSGSVVFNCEFEILGFRAGRAAGGPLAGRSTGKAPSGRWSPGGGPWAPFSPDVFLQKACPPRVRPGLRRAARWPSARPRPAKRPPAQAGHSPAAALAVSSRPQATTTARRRKTF
ncbi:MAG: autotransporter domain-containing protein, partial [Deltaproteobacteria bacterium]|nr:autotransporter domain-containing protein [Deltaproteobacteria bacterium]